MDCDIYLPFVHRIVCTTCCLARSLASSVCSLPYPHSRRLIARLSERAITVAGAEVSCVRFYAGLLSAEVITVVLSVLSSDDGISSITTYKHQC